MFRGPVFALLERIESASSKYGKVTLGSRKLAEKLMRAEAMADALALPQPITPVRKPANAHESAVTDGLRIAAKRPQNAITDAWQFLVDSTCDRICAVTHKRPDTADAIDAASNFVDSGLVRMMLLLMSIPNEDVSGGSAAPDKDEAVRYVNLISRVHQRFAEKTQPPDSGVGAEGGITGE